MRKKRKKNYRRILYTCPNGCTKWLGWFADNHCPECSAHGLESMWNYKKQCWEPTS